jgi:D-3-phosphoglycerate dehydrogenase
MMRLLVAEPEGFSPDARRVLERAGDVELRQVSDATELAQAFGEFDVVWIRLGHRITAEVLGPSPRCRVLAMNTTGTDHVDLEACRERGVRVVCLRGETEFLRTIRATAEHTLLLTLALLRQLAPARDAVREGRFTRGPFKGRELAEKSVGLVGVGRIGTLVAGYFRAFGAEVTGFDPLLEDFPADVRRHDTLVKLCAESDIVSLHAAYGRDTHHLMGPRELAAMRPHAVLVNTARGGVLDEAALLAALASGAIAGAALDVVSGEPTVGADHPVLRYAAAHDHLLVTPHIGGFTHESLAKTERFIAGRVLEALAAEGLGA